MDRLINFEPNLLVSHSSWHCLDLNNQIINLFIEILSKMQLSHHTLNVSLFSLCPQKKGNSNFLSDLEILLNVQCFALILFFQKSSGQMLHNGPFLVSEFTKWNSQDLIDATWLNSTKLIVLAQSKFYWGHESCGQGDHAEQKHWLF